MSISEYETYFHELSRHVAMILPTKEDRVWSFVRGLRLPLQITSKSFASARRFFLCVVYNIRTIEVLHHEVYGVVVWETTFRAATLVLSLVVGAFPVGVILLISPMVNLATNFQPHFRLHVVEAREDQIVNLNHGVIYVAFIMARLGTMPVIAPGTGL